MSRLRLVASLVALAFLSACPGPMPEVPPDGGQLPPPGDGGTLPPPGDAGAPPLSTLRGSLALGHGVTAPADLRVAVLWFPSDDTAMPARPRGAESGPLLATSPLASEWTLDLFAEPPLEARGDFSSPGGGTGLRSVGALVLFRDVDGDGRLTLDAQGDSNDELVGSSAGVMPFDVDGPGLRHLVVWRSGMLGADEAGYRPGFNLVSIDEAFAPPVVLPATTPIPLVVTRDPRHALTFCEAAYASERAEYACGQLVFRTPQVVAIVARSEGALFATVNVLSGPRLVPNARVRLNGVEIFGDGEGGYVHYELFPLLIKEGLNSVRVDAPGLEPVKVEVVLPTSPAFVAPVLNAKFAPGAAIDVSWTGADEAETFDVSVTTESGGGDFVTTTARQATLTAPETPGPATVRISATTQRLRARHVGLGMVDEARGIELEAP